MPKVNPALGCVSNMPLQKLESISSIRRPRIIGIGGFSSEVGKTTLLCELLREFPGCEAIKTTRGHYRSCGKDPHECCVSDLLEAKAVVRSGRELTYTPGKDTGLYWDAGATNVHWVIATDSQVEEGVREALGRVKTDVVFVEGNSFTRTISPDFFVMVVHPGKTAIKTSARKALSLASAVYIARDSNKQTEPAALLAKLVGPDLEMPLFANHEVSSLTAEIRRTLKINRQTQSSEAAS